MKPLFTIVLLSCLLLAACSPALQQGTVESLPSATTSNTQVSTVAATEIATEKSSGQSLSGSTVGPTPGGGKTITGSQPQVIWDTNPNALIVSATNCCGLVPTFARINYIPEAQIWGDGRMIWTQFDENNHRQVLQGQLSQEQMNDFLQGAVSDGFFGWDEMYTSQNAPTDLPTKCIEIQLEGEARKVCEYYEGAPDAFHEMYSELDNGLGLTGQPYRPEKGYLVAYPVEGAGQEGVPAWENQAVSLAESVNGAWIDGPTLEAVWKLVNEQPFGAAVQEGNTVYRISLQIPGVSSAAPPAP